MLSVLLTLCCSIPLPAQEAAEASAVADDPRLSSIVLEQGGRSYTASDVLEELYRHDASLRPALEGNAEYLGFYLDSLRFYNHVRWFSNRLMLEKAGIDAIDAEALAAEAVTWAEERGKDADHPKATLVTAPFEIEVRARLLALQVPEFSNKELRQHFNSSIPEFFGRLKVSWIRVPLFDSETNVALSHEERLALYRKLDQVGSELTAKTLEWEDAVEAHSLDPLSARSGGKVGYLKRTDVRFEEEMRRQLFHGYGVVRPSGSILRGPIFGTQWLYLIRVESIKTEGVVELNRVRDRVIRSLRLKQMHDRLEALSQETERTILLPLTSR